MTATKGSAIKHFFRFEYKNKSSQNKSELNRYYITTQDYVLN